MKVKTTRAKRKTTKATKAVKKTPKRPAQKQPKSSRPGRAAHLKKHQFKPGESENPGGMKKGTSSFRKIVRELLARPIAPKVRAKLRAEFGDDVDTMDQMDLLAYVVVQRALKGDRHAIDAILDRLDPKAVIEVPPVDVKIEIGERRVGQPEGCVGTPLHRQQLLVTIAEAETALAEYDDDGNWIGDPEEVGGVGWPEGMDGKTDADDEAESATGTRVPGRCSTCARRWSEAGLQRVRSNPCGMGRRGINRPI